MVNDVNALLKVLNSMRGESRQLDMQTEVVALRTSEKRRPGKILASYIGMVLAVLMICYKLRKDMMFITMCDKVSLTFGTGIMARFSLRITLFLVCVGLAGLSSELINAFDYLQGARKSSFLYKSYTVYDIHVSFERFEQ